MVIGETLDRERIIPYIGGRHSAGAFRWGIRSMQDILSLMQDPGAWVALVVAVLPRRRLARL